MCNHLYVLGQSRGRGVVTLIGTQSGRASRPGGGRACPKLRLKGVRAPYCVRRLRTPGSGREPSLIETGAEFMTNGDHNLYGGLLRPMLAIAITLLTAGCSKSDNRSDNSAGPAKDKWRWEPAPDSSVAYIVNSPARSDGQADISMYQSGSRRRCWQKSNGYDCLYVSSAGGTFDAKRYKMARLNYNYDDDHALDSFTGYTCQFFPEAGAIEESMAGRRQTSLTKNTVALKGELPNSKPWTADYVENYLTDNGLPAAGTHFDCVELAAQVMNGSLDTVISTSIRYDQLMR